MCGNATQLDYFYKMDEKMNLKLYAKCDSYGIKYDTKYKM